MMRLALLACLLPSLCFGQARQIPSLGFSGYGVRDESVVGSWDGSAADARDWSVRRINGTFSGNAAVSASSFTFDGTGDYIVLGTSLNSLLGGSDAFSISAWIKTSGNGDIIDNSDIDSPYIGTEFLIVAGKLRVDLVQDGSGAGKLARKTSTASVNGGAWTHVAFTYTGSRAVSGIIIYINGAVAAVTSDIDSMDADYTSSTTLEIGARDGGNQPFTGNIDDVAIWTRVLTAVEVRQLYETGKPTH